MNIKPSHEDKSAAARTHKANQRETEVDLYASCVSCFEVDLYASHVLYFEIDLYASCV